MRYKFLMIGAIIFCHLNAHCQNISDPTHILIMSNKKEVIKKKVKFKTKNKFTFIIIDMLEKSESVQVIQSTETEFKFQLTDVKNNELVSRYFSGSGTIANGISGKYNLSIDGIHHEEQSGTFNIIKIITPPSPNSSKKHVGGHFGIVQGLFFLNDGVLSSIFMQDVNYSIGFPMGITVKKRDNFAFDLEVVPSISNEKVGDKNHDNINLLIHPGLLWGVGNNLTFGTRLAFEIGEATHYGITPLLNFGNIFPSGFIEVVLPIRVGSGDPLSIALGIHIGMGF